MLLEGVQPGCYRLLHLLGSGGMGEVYVGEDTHIRRQVAIKVIRAEAASSNRNLTEVVFSNGKVWSL